MADESIILNERYRLLNRIGAGGMSVVYRAQDLALGRLVAIKILHESLTGDPTFLERFRREAHAAASLSHPNVVTVHDVGQDGTRHYIVMELVEGEDLKSIIRHSAPLPLEKALDLTIQICRGVGYAHRAGFVHCDVKPQNVLVTRDDRALVADFGIARVISEATMSRDDLAWGTPHYFSPEQAAGEMATPASDVYAIGVILYEMLSGQLPFEAKSSTALALMHLQNDPPWLTDFIPEIPLPIAKIVGKVLSKEPSARYRMADQFGRILESYRAESVQVTSAGTLFSITDEQLMEPTATSAPVSTTVSEAVEEVESGADWVAIFLGATALLAILGLIPLWISVYHAYTNPVSQPGTLPIVLFAIRSLFV